MRYLARFAFALVVMSATGCGGEDPGLCETFCAKDAECSAPGDEIPRCSEACNYALGVSADISAECGEAAAEVFACVGALPTCEDVDAYWFEIPPESYPCKSADDAAESACMGA